MRTPAAREGAHYKPIRIQIKDTNVLQFNALMFWHE
jgi:hypothetical protein